MIYGSVCSGIEAASVAWHTLGWQPAFFSEIDKFPRAVLAHHFPEVPLHGDFTTIRAGSYGPVDLLVGGTPCQDFSVAGLRAGLAGDRGNLTLEYLRLAGRLRPKWLVWENVPGVLSSDKGRAMGAFLGGLAELGYGFAWRVLDAQYVRVDGFGRAVPQRRRRVFVVGYLGDWRRAAAVLFERESLCGNPAPRREAGEGVAGTLGTSSHDGSRADIDPNHYIPFDTTQLTNPNNRSRYAPGDPCHNLSSQAHPPAIAFALRGREEGSVPEVSGDVVSTLRGTSGGSSRDMIAFAINSHAGAADGRQTNSSHANGGPVGLGIQEGVAYSLRSERTQSVAHSLRAGGFDASEDGTGRGTPLAPVGRWAVRRLTPRECERLQGFPDDFTLIPVGKKLAADGPRYKALGNSMAVNVMRWIGMRISRVEAMHNQFGEAA